MRKKVLSVGSNLRLLGLRNTIFETAGYEVTPARTAAQAINAIRSSCELDAVIVGHSLSANLKTMVVGAAKERALPVIVLHANPYEAHIPEVVANLCGIDGAAIILDVLSRLFAGRITRNLTPHLAKDSRGRPLEPAERQKRSNPNPKTRRSGQDLKFGNLMPSRAAEQTITPIAS